MNPHHVAIIGGGASGVLTAMNLLANPDSEHLAITVHERSGTLARGVAYGTTDRRHLLNVRARHMSAFGLVPHDFMEWAQRRGPVDPQAFLPRADFAAYLTERFSAVADDRFRLCTCEVTDVVRAGARFEVVGCAAGDSAADSVVLAHGHEAPRTLTVDGAPLPDATWHVPNPWDLDRLTALPADARVLVVGSGLTAVDVATTLLGDAPGRQLTFVSRNGQLPMAHIERQHSAWVTTLPEGPLTADGLAYLLRSQFAAAAEQDLDWRVVVDGLRAATPGIWQRLSSEERRVFLERYARDWEVRRHRMAPEVADRIDAYRAAGQLVVRAGSLSSLGVSADELGGTYDAVINCTGPSTDLAAARSPLLRALHARGTIAPDPLALGLATTTCGEVLDVMGQVVDDLYVVGPALKATLWEATAIPEIRQQASRVAARVVRRAERSPSLTP